MQATEKQGNKQRKQTRKKKTLKLVKKKKMSILISIQS